MTHSPDTLPGASSTAGGEEGAVTMGLHLVTAEKLCSVVQGEEHRSLLFLNTGALGF